MTAASVLRTRAALLLLALLVVAPVAAWPQREPPREAVILLHGLGRGPWAMKLLGWRLSRAGYRVHGFRYSARSGSIDAMAAEIHAQYLACCAGQSARVHFVTHSLGGLVLRAYLGGHDPPNLGRVVMLAPPNQGSEIADTLGEWRLFRLVLGPVAPQLGTAEGDLPRQLPVPDCEFGVIAGSRWINPLGALLMEGPHDGTVSVARTRLEGMRDHLVVPHTHTFLMNAKRVAEEVIHFLQTGRFRHDAAGAA